MKFVLFIPLMIISISLCPGWSFKAHAQPLAKPRQTAARQILAAARAEAERQPNYLEEYRVLTYPGGDVPANTGVCTDLIVRAFRGAGYDLQKLVHEDLSKNRSVYPTIWERKAPDRNIDHRRCPNLATWFRRNALSLTTSLDPQNLKEWQPGDVVFYVRQGADHPWHVAVVSDKKADDGMPMIIDSFPPHTSESHRLDEFAPIHSHFRMNRAIK